MIMASAPQKFGESDAGRDRPFGMSQNITRTSAVQYLNLRTAKSVAYASGNRLEPPFNTRIKVVLPAPLWPHSAHFHSRSYCGASGAVSAGANGKKLRRAARRAADSPAGAVSKKAF